MLILVVSVEHLNTFDDYRYRVINQEVAMVALISTTCLSPFQLYSVPSQLEPRLLQAADFHSRFAQVMSTGARNLQPPTTASSNSSADDFIDTYGLHRDAIRVLAAHRHLNASFLHIYTFSSAADEACQAEASDAQGYLTTAVGMEPQPPAVLWR